MCHEITRYLYFNVDTGKKCFEINNKSCVVFIYYLKIVVLVFVHLSFWGIQFVVNPRCWRVVMNYNGRAVAM
jgi:hypothetical protein